LRADSVALLEGWGARGGPEHLINMATCQRRRHLRHEAAAGASNNALDHRDRAGQVRARIHRREGMPLGEATEPKSTHARCKLAEAPWT
jgi:hypothetical protein